MKVLVMGASGATGKHLVRKLLDKGDDVVAFARTESSIALQHERLKVTLGDARDADSIDRAVQGVDAVINAFGPRSLEKSDIQEVFMRNLIAAMNKHKVRRLINLSAWGAGGTLESGTIIVKILTRTMLRHVFRDKIKGEELLFASDIDHTTVCPGRLLDSPARGGVKAALQGHGIEAQITREDLAIFMIDQLSSETWARKSIVVGY